MSSSKIEWTEKVWNPTTGCNKVSQGCKNCYAEIMHKRQTGMNPKKYSRPFLDGAHPYEPDLITPLKWKKGVRVFVNSMSDLFHENIPFDFIDKVFIVMALTPQHTYQVLTKRPERMLKYFQSRKDESAFWDYAKDAAQVLGTELMKLPPLWMWDRTIDDDGNKDSELIWEGEWPLPNVWLGTSVEDQAAADERIPYLVQVPAAVRFLSCEPLLSPINLGLMGTLPHDELHNHIPVYAKINWVIVGGESGHHARPMHPLWAQQLQVQCQQAEVPFFFKQWGQWMPTDKAHATEYSEIVLQPDARTMIMTTDHSAVVMAKVGKKNSGRLLDGKEWNQYPEAVHSSQSTVHS